jgi:hypothetical protein
MLAKIYLFYMVTTLIIYSHKFLSFLSLGHSNYIKFTLTKLFELEQIKNRAVLHTYEVS